MALLAAVARRVNDTGLAALNATGLAQTAPHAAESIGSPTRLRAPPWRIAGGHGSDDVATQIVSPSSMRCSAVGNG